MPWATSCSGAHQGRSEPCHHLMTSRLHRNWLLLDGFSTYCAHFQKSASDSAALQRQGNSGSSSPPAQLLYSLKKPCAGWTSTQAQPECLLLSRSEPDPGVWEQHQGLYSQSISLATFLFGHLLFFKVSTWPLEIHERQQNPKWKISFHTQSSQTLLKSSSLHLDNLLQSKSSSKRAK